MPELVDDPKIADFCTERPEWTRVEAHLIRVVTMATFPQAITLVTQVADVAEEMDHHPDIDIRWRTVTFALSTHSAGGITELDLTLAQRIDELVASFAAG